MKKKCRIIAALLCSALLITAGCDKPTTPSQEPTPETTPIMGTVSIQPTDLVLTDTSLNSLRQAMMGTSQLFAVAYFGYHETIDSELPVDPYTAMQESGPQLCDDLPFLLEIPEDRIVGDTGDLFCIVPLDEDATVAVSMGAWDVVSEQYLYEESIYLSENGEPFLLFCNNTGMEPDTQLYISGPSGEIIWYPELDDNLCAMPLRNDNWDILFHDFSPYREMLIADYKNMEGEWITPTTEMLIGTTWIWERFNKAGLEVSYQVTFAENTLSVLWYDGIDTDAHEFPDAEWELSYEDGYAILSIDFREMAGVLRYNLLYHEIYEMMYFGMDVVQEEMPISWEPLYRYMMLQVVPEPVEMVDDWELAWIQVEDDMQYVEPDTECISIFLNDQNVFRITLTDKVHPKKSFKNKELGVYDGELYSGCGNDRWMAYIGYMGPEDIIYSITLTRDDTLLMQMYWEVDGGVHMVAYKGYRRMS